jgi:membrane peptidoglycan carboxypeptidase
VFIMLSGIGVVALTYYVDGIPTPTQLTLPEATTVYYSDGTTVMARLGAENRTILSPDDMVDSVKQAIVASEDATFWTNPGVDLRGVLRAAWNNVTGGQTEGASTLTQQYARTVMDLKGATYSRKLREAVIAYKLDQTYDKKTILGFYLNTVPFGRGTYGIEAAAQAFFDKSANRRSSNQITVSEAMLLVAMVKQPEPVPSDPERYPGYDPTRPTTPQGRAIALANATNRWEYVRGQMVKLHYLSQVQAGQLTFPGPDLVPYAQWQSTNEAGDLAKPTGLVVQHALSELRGTPPFQGEPKGYLENGGFQIITTISKPAEDAAIKDADITRSTAPKIDQHQSPDWQAALVSVEPNTGRVIAYFGGPSGVGGDFAGWYYDADGVPTGFGSHPPGSSFKIYDMVTALKQGWSLQSVWYSGKPNEAVAFPQWGRPASNPVRNADNAPCMPYCTMSQAAIASLNIPFFAITANLGPANVLETARDAGIDYMWDGNNARQDLRSANIPATMAPSHFGYELGLGQYAITVLDHANGMATMAARGKRAQAHFVKEVLQGGNPVYAEKIVTTSLGVTPQQFADLDATLEQISAGHFSDTWQTAAKTGTWEYSASDTVANAHVWTVGYTNTLATAVWLGTRSGNEPLKSTTDGYNVFGNNYAGPIFKAFMADAMAALFPHPTSAQLHFDPAAFTGNLLPQGAITSPPPPEPTGPSPSPSTTPGTPPSTTTPKPSPTKTP